jgi:2-oxoglutarate ferredoxin oxidoreductase subunit beta
MSTTNTVTPAPTTNKIGLSKSDYSGGKSTLCTGCGHDSITNNIIAAFYQAGINPYDVAKMSGIGCSSKTPAYFMSKSHGFNTVHGRMAPVSTGVHAANKNLKLIGVSGDGDTASIGMGGFVHMIRRNLPIAYVIANNGVYGLTKGQFSATSDKGAKLKTGELNQFEHIDLCSLAIELGCDFVARSFSGDTKQLVPILQAAMKHKGTAVIDVISPCVTFNNHDGSTKSYDYVKDHRFNLQDVGIIEPAQEIKVDYPEGESQNVELPDGSTLMLRKLKSETHNALDRNASLNILREHRSKGEILTGLFYINPETKSLTDSLEIVDKPLAKMTLEETRPSKEVLTKILAGYR